LRHERSFLQAFVIDRTTITNSVFGIAVDGSNSTGRISMTVTDSVLSGNSQDGIVATTSSGHAPIGVMVTIQNPPTTPSVSVRLDRT
jgi:hypothetical protein